MNRTHTHTNGNKYIHIHTYIHTHTHTHTHIYSDKKCQETHSYWEIRTIGEIGNHPKKKKKHTHTHTVSNIKSKLGIK